MIRWLLAAMVLATPAQAANLTVLSAGAFNQVATALIPAFESKSGDHVTLRSDTVGGLVKRIEAGAPFDVVLMSPAGLSKLAKAGKILPLTERQLAKVGVGVGVKAGTAKPDIATVAAFKATMLQARAVAYIDPKSGATSGIYIGQLFKSLGIATAMAPKSVLVKGGLAAEAVADGKADIVLQQISEIVSVPGVVLAGPLPAAIQHVTVYSGAVSTVSAVPDAAKAFLAAVGGPVARPVLIAKGMTPP